MSHRLSCTHFLIVTCLIVGIYIVKIANLLDSDVDKVDSTNIAVDHDDVESVENLMVMGDSLDHLMWFMQISDLHISYFSDRERVEQLKEFCSVNIRAIKPNLVLATGDLTDGKTANGFGSRQIEEEWRIYKDVLSATGVLAITTWLDIRGNHDNFDVISANTSENYFRKYSVQGSTHPRSYLHQHRVGNDTYSFIAVDACLEPGPRRPFNFIGLLNEKEMRALYDYEAQARQSNATIWFGHYPTSAVYSASPGIRHLMRNGIAYLCGHFHTIGGWVPHMYALQKSGVLELELGDWKDSRLYRVAAIDHGLFSFVDMKHSKWPVILITNPKHALYFVPNEAPVSRILHSTHIRILAFSPSPITKVAVRIDDGEWQFCRRVNGPLYVLPWKPESLAGSIHQIEVEVQDQSGRRNSILQPFSIDGSRMSFDLLPRMLLMSRLSVFIQVLLGLSLLINVLPLCWIRIMHHYVKAGKLARPRYSSSCARCFMRKMWLVSTVNRIFYPLVVMAIYIPIGPWFIGYIIENHVSVCFAWGMFVNGTFLPGGFTFVYAVLHLWTFNFPLMLILARCLEYRYEQLQRAVLPPSLPAYVFRQLPMLLLLLFNCYVAYLTIPTYGTLAFFMNPIKTWSVIAAVILWQLAIHMPEHCFRHQMHIFPNGALLHLAADEAMTALHPSSSHNDDT